MNKLLSIAFCAAAVSAFADPAETVLGQVGVTAITNSFTNTIVAVSYDDLALTNGSGIVVSNFVKTTNLDAGDQLAIFQGTGTYDTWLLKENDGVKYWDKNKVTFTIGSDGKLKEGTGTSASDITQAVGTGIWLIRQNPTDGSGNAKPFYIYGKPSTTKTITTTAGVWNLVGNPAQSNVTITAAIAQGDNNDEILVPGEQGLVNYLYKATTNGWLRAKDAEDKWGPAPTIEAGTGFWIKTKEAITINWQPVGK